MKTKHLNIEDFQEKKISKTSLKTIFGGGEPNFVKPNNTLSEDIGAQNTSNGNGGTILPYGNQSDNQSGLTEIEG